MLVVLLLLRILLAAVFLTAAVGKFLDRPGSRKALVEFGVPTVLARPMAIGLPLVELVVAVLLLPPATAWLGALGAFSLLAAFIAGIAYNLARGRRPDCHCFGQIYSAPAGPATLVRNSLLALTAGAVLVLGWSDPGPGPLDWVAGMSAGELAALAVGGVSLAAIAALAWFALQLGRSVGRLQLSVDELRASLGSSSQPAATTARVVPVGLPIGRAAPAFELEALDGGKATLASLLDSRMLMLAFIDPDCGPCRDLLPDLSRWQQRSDLAVVPISRGSASANRREQEAQPLAGVLIQRDREVAAAYEVRGTPSAVLVGVDGRIASSVAGGVDSIRDLVARAPQIAQARTAVPSPMSPSANGGAAPGGLAMGARAPRIELQDLDGDTVTIGGRAGKDAVLLFWRPSCAFCAHMVPDVKTWATSAGNSRTDLVLVALDSRDSNAALDLGAKILLDPDMKAFNAFGAAGTPVAVKVDRRGRVASSLAIGTEQVRALAQAAGLA